MSQGADDNHKSQSHGSPGLRNEALSGPVNEPVAAGEQYQSMDLTENNQYEWSDWFSKPKCFRSGNSTSRGETSTSRGREISAGGEACQRA